LTIQVQARADAIDCPQAQARWFHMVQPPHGISTMRLAGGSGLVRLLF
jgi:hypothetical protein